MNLLIILLIVFSMSSCDPASYYFRKDIYVDEVVKIELVTYTNETYKMVDPLKTTLKFDLLKAKSIEVLEQDKKGEFLEEFEKIVFHSGNDSVEEPTGYCLLWHLENGNFIVFSGTIIDDRCYSMVAEFSKNGDFVKHHAYFAAVPHYDNVLKKYFDNYNVSTYPI